MAESPHRWFRWIANAAVSGLVAVCVVLAIRATNPFPEQSPCTVDARSFECKAFVCDVVSGVGIKAPRCKQIVQQALAQAAESDKVAP